MSSAESTELDSINTFREEYESIFDSLMEYLDEEMTRIINDVEADKITFLKSCEGVTVNYVKMRECIAKRQSRKPKDGKDFQKILEKWTVKS